MRKIIACLAISADGYIARRDGKVDWLDRPGSRGNYGLGAFVRSIDTIIWGRKTYDFALQMGGVAGFGPHIKHYVFSRQPQTPADSVEFVNEPIPAFARRLRKTRGKHVWMMGGASILRSFLDAGEIDEFSMHVIPVMISDGIPLIEPANRDVQLELVSTRRYADGVVHLHYRVLKPV